MLIDSHNLLKSILLLQSFFIALSIDISTNSLEDTVGACGSSRQSPIDIIENFTKCDEIRVKPLKLVDYNTINMNFSYNGKAIYAYPVDKTNITISGSGLPDSLQPFEFVQFHFHWGNTIYNGSEHLINGIRYSLELHFVHKSTIDPQYYAVIGILFELQNNSNPLLNDVISSIDYISTDNNKVKISSINLRSLLPSNIEDFYFYEGSLTAPPCSETVFWTIMKKKVSISEAQMNVFIRKLFVPNVRSIQLLNGRPVLKSACERDDLVNQGSQIIVFKLLYTIITLLYYFII